MQRFLALACFSDDDNALDFFDESTNACANEGMIVSDKDANRFDAIVRPCFSQSVLWLVRVKQIKTVAIGFVEHHCRIYLIQQSGIT